MQDSDLDEESKNSLKREIWCRTSAYAKYRNNLLIRWSHKCAITGLDTPALLIASHIKPWSKCTDNLKHQVDPENGFLIASPIDKLFDRGYLTICDDGRVELHKRGHARHLNKTALSIFGINSNSLPKVKGNLSDKNKDFLRYHREHVFNRK